MTAATDEALVGTCKLCGQVMIRTADDCWHPYDVETACPPQPGPMGDSQENFDAWQAFYDAGLRPGRPGRQHFRGVSAAPDQQPPVKGEGGGTPPRQDETDLWMLVDECGVRPRDGARMMGVHHKRLIYLCEKWSRQGKYDYGVTCDLGWSTTRMMRNRYLTASSITTSSLPNVHVYPKPPPPPFSGASMAMRVVMAGRDTSPALQAANRRAVESVRGRAKADARRIVVRDVRPAPRSTMATRGVLARDLLMTGQAFVSIDPAPGGAVAHFNVLRDGTIRQNVPLEPHRVRMGNRW